MSGPPFDRPPSPRERTVMTILMRHGGYDETQDSMHWLAADAFGAANAADEGTSAVVDALWDTAWFDPTSSDDAWDEVQRVAAEIVAAVDHPDTAATEDTTP